MTRFIYKICPTDIWQEAEDAGSFTGSGIDVIDGYIHFSTAAQTAETLALHFTKQDGLTLVEIDTKSLNITWEESRGGHLFPHLYEALPLSAVRQSWQLTLDGAGIHKLPDLS